MKHNLLKFAFLFICSGFTGCIATHLGTMSGSASLNAPNFIYKKQDVYGEAQAVYILGIGGMENKSLIIEAKKNMLKTNPLMKNQALANVTVSYKSTGFVGVLIRTITCTVSADIVEFGSVQADVSQLQAPNPSTDLPKENLSTAVIKTENKNIEKNTEVKIKVGDNVKIINYFSNPVVGKVIKIQGSDYTVEYKKSNNKIKQVKLLEFQVEKIK